MWLFTQHGFVSAVAHRDNHGMLMVRARDRASIEPLALAASTEIVRTPDADYPYRTTVTASQFTNWCALLFDDIDYPNFKSRVHRNRGSNFVHSLHRVWEAMRDTEDADARS